MVIYEVLKKVFFDDELLEDKLNVEIDKEILMFIFKFFDLLFDNVLVNLKGKYK